MATDTEEALRKVNHLRQRVRTAETTMTEARVKHEQATDDARRAREALDENGVTAKDLEDVDAYLTRQIGKVEELLHKVEIDLEKAQKAADD